MPEFCRLPESELDVMLAVWKQGGEASAPEIGESLGRTLTASALHSYLKRLEEKGFSAAEKRENSIFTPPWCQRRTIAGRRAARCWKSSTAGL